jgi:hypothetical protein
LHADLHVGLPQPVAATEVLKTLCTGASTRRSERMKVESVTASPQTTWRG